jgi:hypothetical protein
MICTALGVALRAAFLIALRRTEAGAAADASLGERQGSLMDLITFLLLPALAREACFSVRQHGCLSSIEYTILRRAPIGICNLSHLDDLGKLAKETGLFSAERLLTPHAQRGNMKKKSARQRGK